MSNSRRNITVVHGGPRQGWNTETLLRRAADGARAGGAHVEWVELYALDFKGCRGCMACKLRSGTSYGRCAQRDGLTPVLESIERSDALLIGSPIYFGSTTGESRSFLERLLFPWFTYTDPPRTLFPRRIPVGVVYTMNVTEEQAEALGYWRHLERTEAALGLVFGQVERLVSGDTLQVEDYGRFVADRWDPVHKAERRRTVFPQDGERAWALGARLTGA